MTTVVSGSGGMGGGGSGGVVGNEDASEPC